MRIHVQKQEGAEDRDGISGEARQEERDRRQACANISMVPTSHISRDLRRAVDGSQESWLTQRLDMHVVV